MNAKYLELKVNKTNSEFQQTKIISSESAYDYIRKFYFDDIHLFESSFILLTNAANKVIAYAKISQGGITGTVVDTRIVLKYAIECLATGIILAHNHPSGTIKPSDQDIILTNKIIQAAKLIDVAVLDHIIVCDTEYYSFADNGQI